MGQGGLHHPEPMKGMCKIRQPVVGAQVVRGGLRLERPLLLRFDIFQPEDKQ